MATMAEFLADYPEGRDAGRYRGGALPLIPCADGAFELALCSHLLFTYSEHLSAAFHVSAVAELCRVAAEVRIFPLVDFAGKPSPHLEPVIAELSARGRRATVEKVPYCFQCGGDAMLRIATA